MCVTRGVNFWNNSNSSFKSIEYDIFDILRAVKQGLSERGVTRNIRVTLKVKRKGIIVSDMPVKDV